MRAAHYQNKTKDGGRFLLGSHSSSLNKKKEKTKKKPKQSSDIHDARLHVIGVKTITFEKIKNAKENCGCG